MKIKAAHNDDLEGISKLTLRSKAFWGYSDSQIQAWKPELTLTKEYLKTHKVFKAVVQEEIIGFYAYGERNDKKIKLTFLFIDPKHIGKGYGKSLLEDFINRMKTFSISIITLDADPNAEKFYQKQGFKTIDKLQSSIKDRFLPIMELKL